MDEEVLVMPGKFYITTAIDYPNNRPHLGHAFEKIGADVQARFRRLQGYRTYFLLGNDENTVKVSRRAAELGLTPKAFVDQMAEVFRSAWKELDISYDDFIQTTEPRHQKGCQKFIQLVYDAGYIYRKAYEGLYCEGCEAFKTAKDLVDGRCEQHPALELKVLREENYFFALSRFRDRLLKLYEERPHFIQPEGRRNEIVSLVETGLEDISITRQKLDWGIVVPFDPGQRIYVWFDALLNYVTGVGYGTDEEKFRQWWPANMHVIGKDITRFHCALWPAMLMAAGLELPERVQVHGFVLLKGAKMSKSLGNVVDPLDLARRFGSDAFRYVLLRLCPFTGDGEFSFDQFAALYNADLANNLGNLYSRTLTMCLRYFDGFLPGTAEFTMTEPLGPAEVEALVRAVTERLEACEYHQALGLLWDQLLDGANRYIDRTRPFELARTDPPACARVLANLAGVLRLAAILVAPFMPSTARALYRGFNFATPFEELRWERAAEVRPFGRDLRVTAELKRGRVVPLFPRIEESV
jgi:methionyl-tRNA synthetase